ncbi:MAG: phosphate signaling complex protein PhoU [Pirellulaceae bacterium]
MSKHLERDIELLEQSLLSLSAIVEEMIAKAWKSVVQNDKQLAQEVVNKDACVDDREVRIEEDCLKILALHQPVAIDLRRTATILKVNNDLERIADLAVNVAERGNRLASATFQMPPVINTMAELAIKIVRDCLNAFVAMDVDSANQVCLADDEIDRCHAEAVSALYLLMKQDAELIAPAIHALAVARHLERIGDHATNIAEDVIYMVQGDIARHKHKSKDGNMLKDIDEA